MKKATLGLVLALVASLAQAAVPGTSSFQDYTGNGATTAFAFTFPTLAVGDVEVLVGGVKQLAGVTVTLNANQATSPGGTATFVVAPVNGAAVRVQRTVALTQGLVLGAHLPFPAKSVEKAFDRLAMQAQQLARTDAELSAIIGTGNPNANIAEITATGSSAPRSLAARAADVVNVRDFGAVGDGATDDTAAIQAAASAAAAAKRELYLPDAAVEYRITNKITLGSRTTVRCAPGAKLHQVTAQRMTFYGSGVSDVAVQGCTIVGPGTMTTVGETDAQIFFTGAARVRVEDCTISSTYNGISVILSDHAVVRGNDITGWMLYGIMVSQTREFHVEGNYIHDSAATGAANSYGIAASGGRPSRLQSANTITGNKINGVPSWDGIMTHDTDALLIASNDIRNVRTGIDVSGNGNAGQWSENVTITGNYLEQTTTDTWAGAAATNSGIALIASPELIRNATIAGNVIRRFNAFHAPIQSSGAIALQGVKGVAVTGNRIYETGAYATNSAGGICLSSTLQDVTVSGNAVTTSNGLPAILLDGVVGTTLSISGNSLNDAGANNDYAVRVGGTTLAQLSLAGNTTASGSPYYVTTSTITRELVDWLPRVGPAIITGALTGTPSSPTFTQGAAAPAADEPVGSLYLRTSGGAATTLYVKTAAGGAGWTAK